MDEMCEMSCGRPATTWTHGFFVCGEPICDTDAYHAAMQDAAEERAAMQREAS